MPAGRRGHGRALPARLIVAAALVAAATITGPAATAAPHSAFTVEPEVPVTPVDERAQVGSNSPLLAHDPTAPRFVALASRLDNPDFGCALHLSGDRGRSWVPANPVAKLPPGAEKCYAPEIAFDRAGTLYYLFIALHGNGNNPSGTYLVTSQDRGRSFTSPRRVLGPERYMVRMAIDRSVGTNGRIHLVWLQAGEDPPLGGLAAAANPIMSAHSDDGGRTFSAPVQVSDPARPRVVAPALALGPDHVIHVLYYDLRDDARDYQGLEGPRWDGPWSVVLATSVDGGQSFSSVAVDEGVVPPERVMLIYTMPPPTLAVDDKGRLFAAWHDARNGDWDVFLRRSVDLGRTWGEPRRLNDDNRGNGRDQYMPRLAAAPNGRLDAIFYDRRNDPGNVRNDVYLTSTADGGATFTKNVRITTESSSSQIGTRYPIPSARGLVEYGSRIALLSDDTRLVAAWTDTRNQDVDSFGQDVFAAEVDLGGSTRSDRPWPVVVGGLAVIAFLVAGAVAVRRSRARTSRGLLS